MDYGTIETVATILGVVATIGTIVGFVGAPIIKLNKTLVRMSVTFDAMENRFCESETKNSEAHKEFRIKDRELEHVVNEHSRDIAVIKQVLKDDLAE